jgi:type II secretion system protein N
MEPKPVGRWRKVAGYPLFFVTCFVFFFHFTLPYGLLQERLVEEARKGGHTLTVASLGPAWGFGVTAKRLAFVSPPAPGPAPTGPAAAPAPDTIIDQVTVRPTLFPPGVKVTAKAFGGEIGAQVEGWVAGVKGEPGAFTRLESLSVKNVDLGKAALKPLLGLDFSGVVNVEGDINHINELSKAVGTFKVGGKDLALVSGTVAMIDLPKVALGAVDVKLKMDSGKTSIDTLTVSGGDVEAKGEGDITLNNHLSSSPSKIRLEFKPAEDWLKKNSFIQMGLSQAGRPDSKGYYTVTLDGMLGNPRPTLKQ